MTRWLQRAGGAKRHRTGPAAAAARAVVRPARPRPARWVHGEARSRRASAWWRAYTTSERCASPGPVARTPCPGSAPPPGDTVAGVEVGDRARARSTRGRPPSPDRGAWLAVLAGLAVAEAGAGARWSAPAGASGEVPVAGPGEDERGAGHRSSFTRGVSAPRNGATTALAAPGRSHARTDERKLR